jgi:N-acyl-D-aspartate/D-glutamate deacylase
MFGYQQVRIDTPPDVVSEGRRLLEVFAAKRGFTLGAVYVEQDVNEPCSALVALIAAARRGRGGGLRAVGVPRAADLGRLDRVQRLTRERLERECGVPVMVAEWWPS